MSKTILITGGLGYVGGRIAQFIEGNTEYTIKLGTRKEDAAAPAWLKRGTIVKMDLLSEEDLDRVCEGTDVIIHLAALNEVQCLADPAQALMINTLATLQLQQAAVRANVKQMIYFSTAHVYGSLSGTITEGTTPQPVHPYAISHLAAEHFVTAAHANGELEGLVIRMSNGFGVPALDPVDRWTLIANDLCRQAVSTKQMILQTSGAQYRDFVTLTDVCRAVVHVMEHIPAAYPNRTFNVGGDCSLRIVDLAEIIASRCSEVLGYTPPFYLRGPIRNGQRGQALDFRINQLKKTGFMLEKPIHAEIDATLRYCLRLFPI
jgi:UDP-glucose 4-epimerase